LFITGEHRNITEVAKAAGNEKKKSQNEAECEGLHTQIRELWDRLQIPEEEKEPVEAIMTGSKTKIRNALKLEVDWLEDLKIQNIKQVIEKIRVEPAQSWDQCFYSQEQGQAFAPYSSEDYTENLLHLHDAEIVWLRNYYDVHRSCSKASRSGKRAGNFS
jgi:protein regulator of cytokinesis 1